MSEYRIETLCDVLKIETKIKLEISGRRTLSPELIIVRGNIKCINSGKCGIDVYKCEIIKNESDKIIENLRKQHREKIKQEEQGDGWNF